MGYLQPIKRLSATENKGGILQIDIARKVDVVSIPSPVYGVIVGDIIFAAGAGFTSWEVTLETPRIKSSSKASREGTTKNSPLTFSIPKDNSVTRQQLLRAEQDEFIVSFKDSNGNRKLFGLKEAPVRFIFDHDGGGRLSDGNRYDCQFYYEGPDNINFYSGSITVAPPSTQTSRVQYLLDDELIAILNPTDVLIVSSDFAHTFSVIPGTGGGLPAIVKWDTDQLIAALQPGDILVVDTDFTFDFELITTP